MMRLLRTAVVVAVAANAYTVPSPKGPYAVAFQNMTLTDESRSDPYASTEQKRRVLVSAYLPVHTSHKECPKRTVPYMSPAVAAYYGQVATQMGLANDTFALFDMEFCDLKKYCGKAKRSNFPLVLYDTGLGTARGLYGSRARALASEGYIVVTLDHPYDADIVELPDGTVINAANVDWDSETEIVKALKIRGQDLSFVLSQLSRNNVDKTLFAKYPSRIDFSRVVAVGHSLGGVASALVASTDAIVRGAVNMDGGLHEPLLSAGLSKPVMQFGRAGHEETDHSWDEWWPRLRGPAAELALANATHGTFTDILTLTSQLDLPDEVNEALQESFGSITPADAEAAITGGLVAAFDFVFDNDAAPISSIHSHFPSITLKRSHD